jgi:hypothetical protein
MAILDLVQTAWKSSFALKLGLLTTTPILLLLTVYFIVVPNAIKVISPLRQPVSSHIKTDPACRTRDGDTFLQAQKATHSLALYSNSQTLKPYATKPLPGANNTAMYSTPRSAEQTTSGSLHHKPSKTSWTSDQTSTLHAPQLPWHKTSYQPADANYSCSTGPNGGASESTATRCST